MSRTATVGMDVLSLRTRYWPDTASLGELKGELIFRPFRNFVFKRTFNYWSPEGTACEAYKEIAYQLSEFQQQRDDISKDWGFACYMLGTATDAAWPCIMLSGEIETCKSVSSKLEREAWWQEHYMKHRFRLVCRSDTSKMQYLAGFYITWRHSAQLADDVVLDKYAGRSILFSANSTSLSEPLQTNDQIATLGGFLLLNSVSYLLTVAHPMATGGRTSSRQASSLAIREAVFLTESDDMDLFEWSSEASSVSVTASVPWIIAYCADLQQSEESSSTQAIPPHHTSMQPQEDIFVPREVMNIDLMSPSRHMPNPSSVDQMRKSAPASDLQSVDPHSTEFTVDYKSLDYKNDTADWALCLFSQSQNHDQLLTNEVAPINPLGLGLDEQHLVVERLAAMDSKSHKVYVKSTRGILKGLIRPSPIFSRLGGSSILSELYEVELESSFWGKSAISYYETC